MTGRRRGERVSIPPAHPLGKAKLTAFPSEIVYRGVMAEYSQGDGTKGSPRGRYTAVCWSAETVIIELSIQLCSS